MKSKIVRGCEVSALSLGTVQMGIPYGLNQAAGKTDTETSFRVLDIAREAGVNWLDTAAAYGDSEQVLGSWLKTVPSGKEPMIATKVNHLDHTSLHTLRTSLRDQVEQSMKRLGLKQIPLLMIHHCEEFFEDSDNMRQVFDELKEDGLIRFSGISAYAFHDYGRIADSGFDAVQIPVNLFDWHQIESGGIRNLAQAGLIVFARSVYLQGLLLRRPEQLNEKMRFCTPALTRFHEICGDFGMEPACLAVSFALSLPGISSLVIGCRNEKQMYNTIQQIEQAHALSENQMEVLHTAFRNVPERVFTPMLW